MHDSLKDVIGPPHVAKAAGRAGAQDAPERGAMAGTAHRSPDLATGAFHRSPDLWHDVLLALHAAVEFRDAIMDGNPVADRALPSGRPFLEETCPPSPQTDGWRIAFGANGAATTLPTARRPGAPHVLDLLPGDCLAALPRVRLLRDADRPFTAEEAATAARLVPMLLMLARRGERGGGGGGAISLGEARIAEALLAVLDQLGLGLCLVDAELRATLVSGRAMRSGGFRVRRGAVTVPDREAEARLRGAVAAVLAAREAPVQGLNLGCAERPLRLLVTGLREPGNPAAPPRLAALILLPEEKPQHAERVIQALFGLTPVEARIAKLLGDGLTPNEAAEQMRLKPNTLRGYMKSIFVKLDVHRQSELVRLVSTSAGLLRGLRPARSPGEEAAPMA